MATSEPIFFIHGNRVVRGSIAKRLGGRQHRVEVSAANYVYADGSEQPIPLNFKRRIGAEEYTRDAAPLLALVADLPKESDDEPT